MIYAQISGGVIVNTLVLDDLTYLPLFEAGFDYCLQVDNLTPQPGIGWTYDGTNFYSPPVSS